MRFPSSRCYHDRCGVARICLCKPRAAHTEPGVISETTLGEGFLKPVR